MVHAGLDLALKREVAIKRATCNDEAALRRFEREVLITSHLQHPSIVPVLDAGRDLDGNPYYVMRKIEGRSLWDTVRECPSSRTAALPIEGRVALVSRLVAAVEAAGYAHARRIIHRDIKPHNILLGPYGETLLIDWGIAQELEQRVTNTDATLRVAPDLAEAGTVCGTPGFMSPEQARGEPLDERTDVYSLGATCAFVLTGRRPFAADDAPSRAITRAAAGEIDASIETCGAPRELLAILRKAMRPDRNARYATATELAVDLRRWCSGQLVTDTANEPLDTIRVCPPRWLQRHRIAVGVIAFSVAALTSISAMSVRRVVDERDGARAAHAATEAEVDELLQFVLVDARPALASALDTNPSDGALEVIADHAVRRAQTRPLTASRLLASSFGRVVIAHAEHTRGHSTNAREELAHAERDLDVLAQHIAAEAGYARHTAAAKAAAERIRAVRAVLDAAPGRPPTTAPP